MRCTLGAVALAESVQDCAGTCCGEWHFIQSRPKWSAVAGAVDANRPRRRQFSSISLRFPMFAVIITIMVLELKSPQGTNLAALKPMVPVFFSYVVSFVYVGIYWNNHHHLLQAAQHVAGAVLWANLHLLFWLSLIPFATTWIGENPLSPWPVALYGVVLLMAGLAYFVLTKELIAHQRAGSMLAISIGRDRKGALSILAYLVAIPLAFVRPWIACAFYVLVALMWLIPDRRIERALGNSE